MPLFVHPDGLPQVASPRIAMIGPACNGPATFAGRRYLLVIIAGPATLASLRRFEQSCLIDFPAPTAAAFFHESVSVRTSGFLFEDDAATRAPEWSGLFKFIGWSAVSDYEFHLVSYWLESCCKGARLVDQCNFPTSLQQSLLAEVDMERRLQRMVSVEGTASEAEMHAPAPFDVCVNCGCYRVFAGRTDLCCAVQGRGSCGPWKQSKKEDGTQGLSLDVHD